MEKEELIIKLIQQDLKHCQLLFGLNKIGLEGDFLHYLGILSIVQDLMDVKDDGSFKMDRTSDAYMHFMYQCLDFPITNDGIELMPLAEECYQDLKEIIDNWQD